MSEFNEYFKNNFRVEENGELSAIRKDCYNGNNLSELISEYHLEKMWDYQQVRIEKLEQQLEDAQELIDLLMEVRDFSSYIYEIAVEGFEEDLLKRLKEVSDKARANQDKINELLKRIRS